MKFFKDSRKEKIKDLSLTDKCYRCDAVFAVTSIRYYRIKIYKGYPSSGQWLCTDCYNKHDYTLANDLYSVPEGIDKDVV